MFKFEGVGKPNTTFFQSNKRRKMDNGNSLSDKEDSELQVVGEFKDWNVY